MSVFMQLFMNGIIAGGIYALVAIGYSLVYGILKFINFAHGEIFMIGAYVAFFLTTYHVPLIVATMLAMLACALLGFIIEKVAYKPLRGKGRLSPLITAIGVSLFLQAFALMVFGSQIRTFPGNVEEGFSFLGAIITKTQLFIILISLLLMLLLVLYVKFTKTGKAMRAVADNLPVASTIGIPVNKIISLVFIMGSMLAAVAGVLIGVEQNLQPTMGVTIGIKAFTAAVVGGIGNIYGAFLGGYFIGIVENLAIWKIDAGYKDAISFVVLLLVLLIKPSGFLGKHEEELRV